MSMDEREKIIQRIKKLKAHAASAAQIGSIQEAEAFTLKMEELMLEYNLTAMEVDSAADKTNSDEFKHWAYTESISYRDTQAGSEWLKQLIRVLVKFNFCDVVYSSSIKMFNIWGHAENIDTVVWLYNHLGVAFFRIGCEEYKKDKENLLMSRRVYLREFLMGAVDGLRAKLRAQQVHHAQANAINALVVINKKALDTYAAQNLGAEHWRKGHSGRPVMGTAAYSKGVQVGKSYNTGGKINGNNNQKSLG